MRKPNSYATFLGGGGACNPLIATVSGLCGKLTLTVCGFSKKGTKKIRHCEERSDEAISLKSHASVQRNVAIASNRDLRKQNTECAARRCNDAVGAVSIHSKACFLFSFGTFLISLIAKRKRKVHRTRFNGDCFASLAMTCEKCRKLLSLKWLCHLAMTGRGKRSFAFTLSEVLIVLAVLGVVAAMTIPDLIQDYREKALITALKKNYSIFEQAIDMAVADNGPITSWNSGKLYNILKPYLRIVKDCGGGTGCFAEHYEALFSENFDAQELDTITYYAKGMLASGASFHTYSAGCIDNYWCGFIGVDVNGKASPNKAGVDYFTFFIIPDGLLPAGREYNNTGFPCTYNGSDRVNGRGCTYWALKHENMDYLRKAGKYVGY